MGDDIPERAIVNQPISELYLTCRPHRILREAGVVTIGDLIRRSELEIFNLRGFGRKSLQEVREQLAKIGLKMNYQK